jgi:hypothetical protein
MRWMMMSFVFLTLFLFVSNYLGYINQKKIYEESLKMWVIRVLGVLEIHRYSETRKPGFRHFGGVGSILGFSSFSL